MKAEDATPGQLGSLLDAMHPNMLSAIHLQNTLMDASTAAATLPLKTESALTESSHSPSKDTSMQASQSSVGSKVYKYERASESLLELQNS